MIPVETLSVLEASGHSQNIYQTLWVSLTLNIASMKGFFRANCSWWALFLGVPCCIAGPVSLWYLGAETDDHQTNPNSNDRAHCGLYSRGCPCYIAGPVQERRPVNPPRNSWIEEPYHSATKICKPNVFFLYAPKSIINITSSEGKDESVEFFGHQNWHRPK